MSKYNNKPLSQDNRNHAKDICQKQHPTIPDIHCVRGKDHENNSSDPEKDLCWDAKKSGGNVEYLEFEGVSPTS